MTIRIVTNKKQFLAEWEKKIKALKKNPVKAARSVAEFIKVNAQLNAPKKTGRLSSGVISRRTKRGATVYAFDPGKRVNGTDALALWADRKIAFNFKKKPGKYFRGGQVVRYGDRAMLVSGRTPRWTGRFRGDAGYFTLAVRKGRRTFGKRMSGAVRAAIRGVRI